MIVDTGAQYTYVTPIQDGMINQRGEIKRFLILNIFFFEGVLRTEVAGEFLTKRLYDILTTRGTIEPRYVATKPASSYNLVSKEFETGAIMVSLSFILFLKVLLSQ